MAQIHVKIWPSLGCLQILEPRVCLHTAMLPMMIMDQSSETLSQPSLNVCLYESCFGHSVLTAMKPYFSSSLLPFRKKRVYFFYQSFSLVQRTG